MPALVAIAASAAVFHGIGFSAWFDEAYSYGLATAPLHVLLGQWAWGSESNMILYYLILKAWLGVTGLIGLAPNETVLRVPSAVFAVAAAVVVYLLGRRLFGTIAGLVAAGLYLANFLQMGVAQLARSSSLELFLLSLSWYALFAALTRGSARRWWALFVASSALAVYAALFSGLVLASEAVALALVLVLPGPWRERVHASIRPAVVSFVLVGVLIAPIALDAVLHGGPVWLAPVGLHVITGLFLAIGGGSRRYELLVFDVAALGFLAAVGRRIVSTRSDTYGPALAMATWFVLPIVIAFALTQPRLNLHLFSNRYLVVVVPPLCLLAGLGVSALRWRPLQAVLAAGLLLVALPQLLHYYDSPHLQDIRGAARWIEARYQPGDGLVCAPAVECAIPIEYYIEADKTAVHFDPDSPGRFSWDGGRTVSLDDAAVLDYAPKHQRVFFVYARSVLDPQAQRLESSLGHGFQEVGRMRARAAVDTWVVLYERISILVSPASGGG